MQNSLRIRDCCVKRKNGTKNDFTITSVPGVFDIMDGTSGENGAKVF